VALCLLGGYSGQLARKYDIHCIPHVFIIGHDGKILKAHAGYGPGLIEELVDDINAALQSAALPVSAAPTAAQ
jgi:hypothetical protein